MMRKSWIWKVKVVNWSERLTYSAWVKRWKVAVISYSKELMIWIENKSKSEVRVIHKESMRAVGLPEEWSVGVLYGFNYWSYVCNISKTASALLLCQPSDYNTTTIIITTSSRAVPKHPVSTWLQSYLIWSLCWKSFSWHLLHSSSDSFWPHSVHIWGKTQWTTYF